MERSKAGTKEKRSPDGLDYPNQNTIKININLNKYKVQWNSINKKQNGLK